MKILVACEESQTVCKAFRSRGFESYSCDIQDCSGGHPEWHIKGDALEQAYSGMYDLMIAHPPCTYLSNAGSTWLYRGGVLNLERLEKLKLAREFFLKILNAPIKYKCIENPLPVKLADLPKHSQVIQPYQFGHEYSKKTLLWLIGLPPLLPTKIMSNYKPLLPSNTGGKKRGQKYTYVSITKKNSSKTFEGIAEAMADQWGGFLNGDYNPDKQMSFLILYDK